MTILQRLAPTREHEDRLAAGEFCKLARLIVQADGRLADALEWARGTRAKPRIIEVLEKAAVTAGTLTDWSSIAPYADISTAFLASLRNVSAFDTMLPFMLPMPLRARSVVVTTGIPAGGAINEGSIKPIRSIALGSKVLDPRKAVAFLIVNDEVFRFGNDVTNALFDAELRGGVAASTDFQFIADLIAGTTPTASAGSTLANITTDLGVLLAAVGTGANSKLFYLASPTNLKKLSLKASSTGAPAFPGLGPTGGELMPGVTAIAVDALGTPGFTLMVDASGLAGASDAIQLGMTRQGTIQMESAPDSPPTAATVPTSLWQNDQRALKAERFYGATVLRTDAVASISGCNY